MKVLLLGDCLKELKSLRENSIDSIVTDPPYHLTSIVKRFGKPNSAPAQYGTDGAFSRASKGFMGKEWDGGDIAQRPDVWIECLRVLKPGGHMIAFSGSRTYHRMAVAIEDAGFDIRDQIMWIYGSGFPKSHNIGDGIGTALKPAHEPIVLARKPLSEKTIKENVLKWGTGGLNIDVSRIVYKDTSDRESVDRSDRQGNMGWRKDAYVNGVGEHTLSPEYAKGNDTGRWPANIIFDEEAGQVLDQQSGISKGNKPGSIRKGTSNFLSNFETEQSERTGYNDLGGASKFFYCPKTSKKDRDEGLDLQDDKILNRVNSGGLENDPKWGPTVRKNNHPTVKPTELMLYLIKLVTPKGGTVLDPFMGSGSTGKAAIRGGFDFVGIEKEEEYIKIAEARINNEIK